MSQPTPYNRLYNFTDFQTVNPAKPLPATSLDAELNAIELTTDQTRANLALLQRDDGALANQLVTPESLSAATLAIITQGEYVPRGSWSAGVVYAAGDLVTYNAATYLCIVAHTSVIAFPTDNNAGKWLLIANGALQGNSQTVDTFTGNGTTTVFTLTTNYSGNNAATVFVAGVAQIPTQDFTIAGTTLTFVTAPPAPSVPGRKNVMVRGPGVETQLFADAAQTASSNAQGFASAASASAASASDSAAAAAASYDSFDDRWLGAKVTNPTVDNDGNALVVGAAYFNSAAANLRIWNGTEWQLASAIPDTVAQREFTATANQTSYEFLGGYRVGFTFVWVNGALLGAADITATNGTTITFTSPLAGNSKVKIITFKTVGSVSIQDLDGLQAQMDEILNTALLAIANSGTGYATLLKFA